MTLSILALKKDTGALGCAAATGNLAVGGWVLRSLQGVGAVATQGFSVSHLWGDKAMTLLASGQLAGDVVETLTAADPGREYRQLAVLDCHGNSAGWTGKQNTDYKNHITSNGLIIAGNWLANDTVLDSMLETYQNNNNDDFAKLLVNTLEAGINAGGDSRGTLSAAIRIVENTAPPLDLRVDYDDAPLDRLKALYRRATSEPYSEWIDKVPTIDDPYRH